LTSNAAVPTHPAGLRSKAEEARDRLRPEPPVIPAPRNPGGIDVPVSFDGFGAAPPKDVTAALDALVTRLSEIEQAPDVPAHHALARIGELTSAGVPDEGWSGDERIDTAVLSDAATIAAELHEQAAALLERLDAADLAASAAVIDSLSTSLRVIRMVADLEVFALSRH
jgi:hypothetical protein